MTSSRVVWKGPTPGAEFEHDLPGALRVIAYQVNALEQRIRKTNSTEDRVFLYDTRGRLIVEADPRGTLEREYLYLNDIPLMVFQ